jgi:ribonuclease BN (tRNA processing enzyme)
VALTLTVLGNSSGGVPGPGGAGSGYLVESGGTRLLVDCGNGVLGHLARVARYEDVSGVYLSHLHADHVLDLMPLTLHARFTKRRLPVFGPEGLRTLLYRWFFLFHANPDAYVESLQVKELKPWDAFQVGDLRLQACPVEHNVPAFALRVEPAAGGARLVYSADTKGGALVTEAALDADLFLAEATFQDLLPGRAPEASRQHHMTAREAGEVATAARAKRLLLTHLLHDLDPARSVEEARHAYAGPVDVARVGERYEVTRA